VVYLFLACALTIGCITLLDCFAPVADWVDDSPSALAVALASAEMKMDSEPLSSRVTDTCSWFGMLSLVLETLSMAVTDLFLLKGRYEKGFSLYPICLP
jgi:hypothetical protein